MLKKVKNWIIKKMDAYFFFAVLVFFMSAYFLLLDDFSQYKSTISILLSPKDLKTAIYLDKIRENCIVIAKSNNIIDEGVILKIEKSTSLIDVQVSADSQIKANNLSENSAKNLINLISSHYDIKNDLSLKIVSRKSWGENIGQLEIIIKSLSIGLVLALLVQMLIGWVEKVLLFFIENRKRYIRENKKAQKKLGMFFEKNRETIRKLYTDTPSKNRGQVMGQQVDLKNNETEINFKKAVSPFNLPIAREDLDKIMQVENFSDNSIANSSPIETGNLVDITQEPTEEDFKRRLNQLLGNK